MAKKRSSKKTPSARDIWAGAKSQQQSGKPMTGESVTRRIEHVAAHRKRAEAVTKKKRQSRRSR